MDTRIEVITPQKAEEYLKKNLCNRHLRWHAVERYAQDMRNGRWGVTHQGIGFDESGNLLDGQHRLHAIIQAGVSIQMAVTRGMNRGDILFIDRHRSRSIVDCLIIDGYEVTKDAVAIANTMIRGVAEHKPIISAPMVREFIDLNRDAIAFAVQLVAARMKVFSSSSVIGVAGRAFYSADHDIVREFFRVVQSGEGSSREDAAAIKLRAFLTRVLGYGGVNSHNKGEIYRKTQWCLNRHLRSMPFDKVSESQEDYFPLPRDRMPTWMSD